MLEKNTIMIWDSLQGIMSEHLCHVPSKDEMDSSFIELGANSLILLEFSRSIEKVFGIRIELRKFFEEVATVDDLCNFLKDNLTDEWTPLSKEQPVKELGDRLEVNNNGVNNSLDFLSQDNVDVDEANAKLPYFDRLLNYQVYATSQGITRVIEKQLAFLQNIKGVNPNIAEKISSNSNINIKTGKGEILWGLPSLEKRKLTPSQYLFIEKLQHNFSEKTTKSKAIALESRKYFANNRPSLGFRKETKEMFYPIICSHSNGAYLYDIDGNEYIDLALGFGANMFGHKPSFIFNEMNEQIEKGIQIGPQSELTAKVAKEFCEITGNERVTFYNSGTEAVMTGIRVARAATGKDKIVLFSGSYHGHSDSTLMVSDGSGGKPATQPLCIGIPNINTHNVVVLPYDNESALETIASLKDELAAVLVEPVQSRQPSLQPASFLKKLKKLTSDSNIILIFDEMITGFRIKPGGAQAYFNIKPDLSTYGKVIGGGMPIGCLAGRADLMSYIDGGFWNYGDESYPNVQKIFTGGTFCNHPLTMRCALAVLKRIKSEGEKLQDHLTKNTETFGKEINRFFEEENVPIQMINFGSLFRFVMSSNHSYVYQPLEMDLFHTLLICKGVFTWEGRTCYISTAHTEEVLEKLMERIKSAVLEMKAGGFFLEKAKKGVIQEQLKMQVPLTESQKQLWFLYYTNKAAFNAYTYAIGFKIKGNIDKDILKKSIQTLVLNHDALRTSFDKKGELQTILPKIDVAFTELDFTSYGLNKQKSEIQKWFLDQYSLGFKLENAPLFRIYLLEISKAEKLFVMFSHHIIMDGISEQVVIREIIKNYNTIQSGQPLLQENVMQFSQYIQALHGQVYQEHINTKKDYWVNKITDMPLTINLPTDRVHPPKPSFKGARKKIVVNQELSDFIKDYSKKNGCSNFMTWISFYILWLHKISSQEELMVFTTSSGRYFENTSSMVGYSANAIIVKSELSHNPTFEKFMKEMKTELLDVFEHQEYPFSNLISEFGDTLKLENGLPFTALFNMDHIHMDKMGDADLELYIVPIQSVISDLSLNVTETDDEFILCFDYNSDIFEKKSINRFIDTFIPMVENALSDTKSSVSNIVLQEEANIDLVTKIWNETSLHYGRYNYIHELFEAQVKATPQKIALVVGCQSLTYDELNRISNQLGHFLIEQDITPNQPVGLFFNNSVELIIGILGILKTGNAYVPIDPRYPNERVANIIGESNISSVVTMEGFLDKLPKAIKTIAIDRDFAKIKQQSEDDLHIDIKPDYLCYVINTSGSTGLPKSVGLTHKNITNMINWYLSTNQIRSEDKVFLFTSICFDLTQKNIYTALSVGAELHLSLISIYDPKEIGTYIKNEKITWITCTPSMIAPMIESKSDEILSKLESIRYIYLGGEVVRKSIFKNWIESKFCNAIIVNYYGPTECSDVVTAYTISKADFYKEGEIPIGKPIPNVKVYILDKYQKPLPIGVVGEICIAGIGVSSGYLNDDEKTKSKFIPNPFSTNEAPIIYRTGDLGKFRDDGNIEIIGRNDNQLKIRGYRIELEEIESVIIKHEMISNVVVSAKKINSSEVRLIAYISLDKDNAKENPLSSKDIKNFVKDRLPEYMLPEQFIVLDSFILTSNGKIDKKKLEEQSGIILEDYDCSIPENIIEEQLVEIFKDLLGIQKIGTNSNFFDLGGHSLKAVGLAAILEEKFNIQLSLKDIFSAGTIKKMASLIYAKKQLEGSSGDNSTTEGYVDLSQEAILASDIQSLLPAEPKEQPDAIFLTGATGFVGRFLLRRLLDDNKQAKIYCLVRASNRQQATARLKEVLSRWDLWREGDDNRLEAIPGDLSKSNLGLGFVEYQRLAGCVDSIFHCASSVNHFENYATAKVTNVDCLNELLRLSITRRPKLFNHVSTLSIFNPDGYPTGRIVDETSQINDENHLMVNGYETSKWVAEKIVLLAQSRGLPCNIYRLGLVWADSEKGRFDPQQREYRILESCILAGCGITNYTYDIQPVPVDYVVNAISALAKTNPHGGKIFHIGGSEGLEINICECFDEKLKSTIKAVSLFNWIKHIKSLHLQGQTLPSVPFVAYAFSMDQKSFEDYHVNATQKCILYNWKKTQDELKLLGIIAPNFDHRMVRLALNHILAGDNVFEKKQ